MHSCKVIDFGTEIQRVYIPIFNFLLIMHHDIGDRWHFPNLRRFGDDFRYSTENRNFSDPLWNSIDG